MEAALITVVTDLEEVAALAVLERRHGKVIEQQHIDLRQALEHSSDAAVGMGYGQFPK